MTLVTFPGLQSHVLMSMVHRGPSYKQKKMVPILVPQSEPLAEIEAGGDNGQLLRLMSLLLLTPPPHTHTYTAAAS